MQIPSLFSAIPAAVNSGLRMLGVDASAKVALLEPEKAGAGSAIVVENQFGSVVIDKPGYGTEIPDEKSPPSPVKRCRFTRTVTRELDPNDQSPLTNIRC